MTPRTRLTIHLVAITLVLASLASALYIFPSGTTYNVSITTTNLLVNNTYQNITLGTFLVNYTGSTIAYNATDWRKGGKSIAMHWSFDQNTNTSGGILDHSTWAIHMTPAASAPFWGPGKVGGAFTSNGTKKIDFGSNAFTLDNNYTVAFWVYWNGQLANEGAIIGDNAATYGFLNLYQWATTAYQAIKFEPSSADGYGFNIGIGNIQSNWTHVTLVFGSNATNKTVTPYVNGVVANSSRPTRSVAGGVNDLSVRYIFGGYTGAAAPSLNGSLDELYIFPNMSLTQAQVERLYEDGLEGMSMKTLTTEYLTVNDAWNVCVSSTNSTATSGVECSDVVTVTNLTAPPMISLQAPADGARTANWFNLSATMVTQFNASAGCNITLDSAKVLTRQSVQNNTGFNATVNSLTDGPHYWNATCYDGIYYNHSTTRSFTVDSTPAAISLLYPATGVDSLQADYNFSWSAFDAGSANMSCNLTIDSVTNMSFIQSVNSTPTNRTIREFLSGTHSWNVSCYDGLQWNTSATRTFVVQPNVNLSFISPVNGTVMWGDANATFNVTYSVETREAFDFLWFEALCDDLSTSTISYGSCTVLASSNLSTYQNVTVGEMDLTGHGNVSVRVDMLLFQGFPTVIANISVFFNVTATPSNISGGQTGGGGLSGGGGGGTVVPQTQVPSQASGIVNVKTDIGGLDILQPINPDGIVQPFCKIGDMAPTIPLEFFNPFPTDTTYMFVIEGLNCSSREPVYVKGKTSVSLNLSSCQCPTDVGAVLEGYLKVTDPRDDDAFARIRVRLTGSPLSGGSIVALAAGVVILLGGIIGLIVVGFAGSRRRR